MTLSSSLSLVGHPSFEGVLRFVFRLVREFEKLYSPADLSRLNQYVIVCRTKVDTSISFPLHELDMSEFAPGGGSKRSHCLYDLAAVIVHHGTG